MLRNRLTDVRTNRTALLAADTIACEDAESTCRGELRPDEYVARLPEVELGRN